LHGLRSAKGSIRAEINGPKLISIVQKTWKKMSERGHEAALKLAPALPADLLAVVQKAISAG
jgi:hypothetical protein